jgi:murein DD-endopeptidase MepM/ murein hydrolase activator NlpD
MGYPPVNIFGNGPSQLSIASAAKAPDANPKSIISSMGGRDRVEQGLSSLSSDDRGRVASAFGGEPQLRAALDGQTHYAMPQAAATPAAAPVAAPVAAPAATPAAEAPPAATPAPPASDATTPNARMAALLGVKNVNDATPDPTTSGTPSSPATSTAPNTTGAPNSPGASPGGSYKIGDKSVQGLVDYTPGQKSTAGALGVDGNKWTAYRAGLSSIEGNKYDMIGGAGNKYTGRYQFGPGALSDTAKSLGEPTPSREQFMKDPAMQERYLDQFTLNNHNTLMKSSPEYRALSPEDKLGALAYAHNQGAGWGSGNTVGAQQYLQTGQSGRDGFGTSGSMYPARISQALSSAPTSSAGTTAANNASPSGESPNGGGTQTASNDSATQKVLFHPIDSSQLSGTVGSTSASMGAGRHQGVDVMAPRGTPVYAPDDGKVTKIGTDNFGQPTMTIEHPDGKSTRYLHMGDNSVKVGDTVKGGQQVGTSGSANGVDHLHVERWAGRPGNGTLLNPRDEFGWGRGDRVQIVGGSQTTGGQPNTQVASNTTPNRAPSTGTPSGASPAAPSGGGSRASGGSSVPSAAPSASGSRVASAEPPGPQSPRWSVSPMPQSKGGVAAPKTDKAEPATTMAATDVGQISPRYTAPSPDPSPNFLASLERDRSKRRVASGGTSVKKVA